MPDTRAPDSALSGQIQARAARFWPASLTKPGWRAKSSHARALAVVALRLEMRAKVNEAGQGAPHRDATGACCLLITCPWRCLDDVPEFAFRSRACLRFVLLPCRRLPRGNPQG